MLYFRYSKGRETYKMTTFTFIILIAFVGMLVAQFGAAIELDCVGMAVVYGFEILAFAYLAKVLM